MKIITICGSMKYMSEMNVITKKLVEEGNCVLTPVLRKDKKINEEEKKILKKIHFKKIEMSDIVFILNKDDYIGESTKLEIEYAEMLNKEIVYYSELIDKKEKKKGIKNNG